MMLDTKRATVFLGHDLIIANAILQVTSSMGLVDVPKGLLSEYAKDRLCDRSVYVGDAFTAVHVETDFQYDIGGMPIIRDGLVAGNAVVVDSNDGTARIPDEDSVETLRRLVDGAIESDAVLANILLSQAPRMWLLDEMTAHVLGTKAVTGEDIPLGKPLVLMDIDDCLNVFEYDSSWYAHDRVSQSDQYPLNRDDYVIFPDAVVGMNSVGRVVPKEMRIRWSSELARDIAMFATETEATFVWVTSWHQYSKAFEMMLWPDGDSPFVGYLPWSLRGMSDDGRYGKHLGISELFGTTCCESGVGEHVEETSEFSLLDVPCVTIIDDKGESFGENFFASAVPSAMPELTIAPDGRYGITRSQWQSVRDFVAGHLGS